MKNTLTLYAVASLLFFLIANSNKSFAQILSYSDATDGSLNFVAPNATGTNLVRVNGADTDDSPCSTGFSVTNFATTNAYSESDAALEVSVSPDPGFYLNVTGFSAEVSRAGTGPSFLRFAYSIDGGNNWIDEGSDQSVHPGPCSKGYPLSWQTSFVVNAPNKLIFRMYGFDANKNSGSLQVFNLDINGDVSSTLATCGVATGLSAGSITTSSATLDWNDVSGTTGYNVRYRETGTSTWTNTTASSSSIGISGLSSSTTYEFQVQTVCSSGTSAYSSSATFTTATPPCGVATGLSAGSITTSSATLDWNDVSGATSYNVRYRQTGTSTWTNTTAGSSSIGISGLSSSTTYEFQVQTICPSNTSAYSSSATFTTAAPACGVATGLSAGSITTSSATLDWNDVSGATGYNVHYRETGTSTWTNTTASSSSTGISGLSSSTTYEFQVQTICLSNTSAYSSSATFTTAAPACGVATGLSAGSITTSSATLDWNDVSGATGYNVHYRQTGTSTWTNTTAGSSSLGISGLSSSTTYEFQVQTVCFSGSSAYSPSATFTTATPPCGVATGLSAGSITTSSATLDWNDVSGATGYNVHYRQTGTSNWTNTTASSSSLGISGLSSSTTYEFQVQTVCSSNTSAYSSSSTFTTSGSGSTIPTPDHVVILILENHSYSSIIGSSAAPRINALAQDANSALFTQSFGIERPSQPNYLDFYSGSNQGVTDNNIPVNNPFTTPNLGRELIDASRSFATYSEDLPSVGYNGATYNNYARKHNPVANWMGTGTNQVPETTNQPFTAFPTDYTKLPTVSYVVPNQNNDMHNGSDPDRITVADNWMYDNLNSYIQWAKTHNSLFILTFDEGGSTDNHIVTIFTGPMVAAGQYTNHIDHFNVLRTIEDMFGLPHAGNASSPITNCWKSNLTTMVPTNSRLTETEAISPDMVKVYPNPAKSWINFNLKKLPLSPVRIKIFDMMGRLEGQYQMSNTQHIKIDISGLSKGNYHFTMMQNNSLLHSGSFIVGENSGRSRN